MFKLNDIIIALDFVFHCTIRNISKKATDATNSNDSVAVTSYLRLYSAKK